MPNSAPIRTAIYVTNRPDDQDPEQKLQAELELCRDYCKEQGFEVIAEYSDPKGSRKAFDHMMAVATGRRPPFDNSPAEAGGRRNFPAPRPVARQVQRQVRPRRQDLINLDPAEARGPATVHETRKD